MKKSIIFSALMFFLACNAFSQDMDLKKLKLVLAKKATIVQEKDNMVEYELGGVNIYLIVDENANRMRLMAGVIEEEKLKEEDLKKLMSANFDRALDAKYAIADGILWSVYAHPLKELSDTQATDAMNQVKNLVYNYGTTYHSTDFVFGGDGEQDDN
ncbi:hypothetical protein QQ008_16465 [Fulvivirgaceae bacterium BMA10]|uniref:Uncharacterized protein n=1 Tax=Splendidivirga corallicola TaxID=3051826 RepID=A0ABT8KQI3_9BACT|nr:hypothetical protein [Fulvivirgaceae bacterium BMA10]